jgi:hypothetical protein
MNDFLRLAVVIPLAAASITGVFVLALALALAAWRGWPSVYAFIAAGAAALLSWLIWYARFAEVVAHRIAPDLHPAQPQPPQDMTPKEINLRIHEERGEFLQGTFLDRLPVGADTLAALATQAISGQSLTTSAVTAGGISRANWELLRDRFINAGLLQWRGGNRQYGVETTPRGRVVFSRLANHTPPSHPPARMG